MTKEDMKEQVEAVARATACRAAAVEIMRRAQDIVLNAPCNCGDFPGEDLCPLCGTYQEVDVDIKYLSDRIAPAGEPVRCVDCDWSGRDGALIERTIEDEDFHACPSCDSVAGIIVPAKGGRHD